MAHYHAGSDGGTDSAYVAAALDAKANLYKESKAQKLAQKSKTQRRTAQPQQLQAQQQKMVQQPQHVARSSAPAMTLNQQQLALQQGQLIMSTQLHHHRLRGQYFSAYEKKPWYCDCAGTNIGCAGGTVKGDFQYRDLAYWKCEMDSRGLSKCGVSFCNACVIRDEQLRQAPVATQQGSMNNPQQMYVNGNQRASANMGSGQGGVYQQNSLRGGGGGSSIGSTMSASEMAALQQINDNKGKKKSSKSQNGALGSKVYQEPNVVKRGWMLKRGNIVKSWKRRWFVLRDDRQLYYYSNDKTSTVKGVAQFFDVEHIVKHDKQILSVELKGGRTWNFSCATEEDRNDWCAKLKVLCKAPVMVAKQKDTNAKGKGNEEQKE